MRRSQLALLAPLFAGAALVALPASAQEQGNRTPPPTRVPAASVNVAPAPTGAPKLIVAISIDQLSADLLNQYRGQWGGGFARLLNQGVVFPQAYQAHAATETCPGHSVILTGAHPSRSGIIANNWFDLSIAREDKRVYCSEDPSVPGTSSASGRYAPSSQYLRVPTLGERMKAANPATRVVAVAGKDRAVLMMTGRNADEQWWLAPTGLASVRGREPSADVGQISAAIQRAIAAPRAALTLPADCARYDRAVALPQGRSVGTGRFAREGGSFRAFLASPEADGAVLAAAAALRQSRRLGEGPQTDLLAIGLSATDYVGHSYGTEGSEMCLQLRGLDRELGDFFTRLDASGVDYMVMLTADHGGHDLPERNRDQAAPTAQRVDMALAPANLSQRIARELGIATNAPLLYGDAPFGDLYISRALTPRDATRVRDAAVRILSAHPQVERVVLGSDLARRAMPTRSPELWDVTDRLRANYDPERSGDIFLVLKDRVTPIPEAGVGYVATHGSVWDYDRRVPLIFWRRGMQGFEQPNPVLVADAMPTLASWIGLSIPANEIDGQCRDLLPGPETSCR